MRRNGTYELRRALRHLGRATRPLLSAATGLSKVRVNQIVTDMVARGELRELPQALTTKGRPARQYEFAPRFAEHLLIFVRAEEGAYGVDLELLDAVGKVKRAQHRRYAHLQTSSFMGILEEYGRVGLESVILCIGADLRFSGLRDMVRERCSCPLHIYDLSTALAERREGYLSIYFDKGSVPHAHVDLGGQLRRTGDLSLLPLPSTWENLDYSDHTLLEEMVARLVLFLVCSLSPSRVFLQADFWNERLTSRIRFNCASKLKESAGVGLVFIELQGISRTAQLRRLVNWGQ